MYASNIRASQYSKHILRELRALIESNTVTVGDFRTPLEQWADLPAVNQQRNMEFEHYFIGMDLTGTCRLFHPAAGEHTFFS